MILGTLLGFVVALVLNITGVKGLSPNRWINLIVDSIVNVLRSFPFIILMVAIIPLTRAIMGTSIGEKAAIVPLTIAAAPFIARVIDNSMNEVNQQLVEVAQSFGATNLQIIFKLF